MLALLKLLPLKKIAGYAGLVTALIAILNYVYGLGFDSATVQHNLEITKQVEKYNQELERKYKEYNKSLVTIEKERNKYWQDKLAEKEAELKHQYAEQQIVTEIKHEVETITVNNCDDIGNDAIRLFNKSRAIISPDESYRSATTTESSTTNNK